RHKPRKLLPRPERLRRAQLSRFRGKRVTFSQIYKIYGKVRLRLLFGDDLIDSIVNLKVLAPICDHQATRSQEQNIDFTDRLFKYMLQRRVRSIAEISTKAVGSNSGKKSNNKAQRFPP